jgi:hypothetical protein
MRFSAATLAGVVLFAGIAYAQNASDGADSGQSVAAAARASRAGIQVRQAKLADIRQLLQITGAPNLANQSLDGLDKSMRSIVSDSLPPGEYREKLVSLFMEKFRSKWNTDQLMDLMIPIYDKYYSDDEIKALIQIYQTPVGQKMLSVLPKVMAESQQAGMTWGQNLGRQCMQEVLAEHPELAQAAGQAAKNAQSQQQ